MKRTFIPPPLRRSTFRRLWVGMVTSYAGDRLQQLAQPWLVATLTSSTLAVGMLWTGVAIDWLGLVALVGGAVALAWFSVVVAFATRRLVELTK